MVSAFKFQAVIMLLTGICCSCGLAASATQPPERAYLLLPVPRQVQYQEGIVKSPVAELSRMIKIDPATVPHEQGYELTIAPEQVSIIGHDQAGLFYAEQTLNQLLAQADNGKLTCLTIRDWPDFPVRGVMLDISRDKVPTMDTLFTLVDMLASWKINHFELYTEHTFAYQNHETVWKDASPMTADQIRILDKYCRERFIDLAPNQNSFGHMERWIQHEEYRHLAEAPDYVNTIWGKRRWHTLYPADPGSIALISELYDELLPNFSSRYFNVGCDETVELGNGRSKERCEEIGRDQVYLDYLLKIHALVEKHGKTMMFWADMIQDHPEAMQSLPKDIIPLLWGYSETHPFEKYCKVVAGTGCRFYVCPGNSTWISIAGQTDRARANLLNAAENGKKYGAEGYLITDWGDLGAWEPITVSYLGYAYGAALGWSVEHNREIDLPGVLNAFAFKDKAGIMGRLMYDLGNAYQVGDVITSNSSWFGRLLLFEDWDLNKGPGSQLTVEKVEALRRYVAGVMSKLDKAEIDRPDAGYILDEIRQVARLIDHACDLATARLNAEDKKTANIPKPIREKLAVDMRAIEKNHRKLWLRRNREGGLGDSLSRMENQLRLYQP